MTGLVLAGLLLAVAFAVYAAIVERGANPVLVACQRYGLMPWAVGGAVLTAAVAVAVSPAWTLVTIATVASVGHLAGRGPARWWRLVRRAIIRGRWASVARSSNLAVTRDWRSGSLLGATTTITDRKVEHLPSISWGRAVRGGVRWRLTPARGATLDDVAKAATQLAAGLRVAAVEIEQTRPYRGKLTCYWRDREGEL